MLDVAKQSGIEVNPEKLAAQLGIPVIAMVASRRQGIAELQQAIDRKSVV